MTKKVTLELELTPDDAQKLQQLSDGEKEELQKQLHRWLKKSENRLSLTPRNFGGALDNKNVREQAHPRL